MSERGTQVNAGSQEAKAGLKTCLPFSVPFMEISPLAFLPPSLSRCLALLHYPKLAGNSSMGEKDVREGERKGLFAAASKAAWT